MAMEDGIADIHEDLKDDKDLTKKFYEIQFYIEELEKEGVKLRHDNKALRDVIQIKKEEA